MKKSSEVKSGKSLIYPTNKPLSEQELIKEIRKAESGPFLSVQEGLKDFEQWLQSRENK